MSSLLMELKSILDKIKIAFWQWLPKGRQKTDVLRGCVFRSVPQPLWEGVLVPHILQMADYPGCLPADQLLTKYWVTLPTCCRGSLWVCPLACGVTRVLVVALPGMVLAARARGEDRATLCRSWLVPAGPSQHEGLAVCPVAARTPCRDPDCPGSTAGRDQVRPGDWRTRAVSSTCVWVSIPEAVIISFLMTNEVN